MASHIHRLTFRHLRVIVSIADQCSLIGAAQHLYMTQSAVTKALQEAEAILGIALFERTTRGAVPTIFAHGLIAHARHIFVQLDQAGEELGDLRDGNGGRVAVGTQWSASADLLPRAITEIRLERPRVTASVVEGTNDLLMPELRRGELDLVVGRLPQFREREEICHEILFEDIACVVASPKHPSARCATVRLTALQGAGWILPKRETTLRRQVDKAFRDEGIEPPANAVESVSMVTNSDLIVAAGYLAVWPWQVAKRDVKAGRIVILPVTLPATITPVGISTRVGAPLAPAAQALADRLREVATRIERCPLLPAMPAGNS